MYSTIVENSCALFQISSSILSKLVILGIKMIKRSVLSRIHLKKAAYPNRFLPICIQMTTYQPLQHKSSSSRGVLVLCIKAFVILVAIYPYLLDLLVCTHYLEPSWSYSMRNHKFSLCLLDQSAHYHFWCSCESTHGDEGNSTPEVAQRKFFLSPPKIFCSSPYSAYNIIYRF